MQQVGMGYDIHRLVEGRKLFIGGIEIPYVKGLLGHSDGDVLLHAICDALLGAFGQGDIGEQFPDTEAKYHDMRSTELLKNVLALLKKEKFSIVNLDTVVVAQEPVLTPFKKQIRQKISEVLKIDEGCIGIKAKTSEGMGEIGRAEAIAAYAVVMITKGD